MKNYRTFLGEDFKAIHEQEKKLFNEGNSLPKGANWVDGPDDWCNAHGFRNKLVGDDLYYQTNNKTGVIFDYFNKNGKSRYANYPHSVYDKIRPGVSPDDIRDELDREYEARYGTDESLTEDTVKQDGK